MASASPPPPPPPPHYSRIEALLVSCVHQAFASQLSDTHLRRVKDTFLLQLRTIQAITTLLPQLTSEVQAQRYLDEFLDSCYAMVKRSSRSVLQVSSSGNRRSSGSASSSSSVSPPSAAAPAVVVPPVPPSSRSRAINVRISLQQMLKREQERLSERVVNKTSANAKRQKNNDTDTTRHRKAKRSGTGNRLLRGKTKKASSSDVTDGNGTSLRRSARIRRKKKGGGMNKTGIGAVDGAAAADDDDNACVLHSFALPVHSIRKRQRRQPQQKQKKKKRKKRNTSQTQQPLQVQQHLQREKEKMAPSATLQLQTKPLTIGTDEPTQQQQQPIPNGTAQQQQQQQQQQQHQSMNVSSAALSVVDSVLFLRKQLRQSKEHSQDGVGAMHMHMHRQHQRILDRSAIELLVRPTMRSVWMQNVNVKKNKNKTSDTTTNINTNTTENNINNTITIVSSSSSSSYKPSHTHTIKPPYSNSNTITNTNTVHSTNGTILHTTSASAFVHAPPSTHTLPTTPSTATSTVIRSNKRDHIRSKSLTSRTITDFSSSKHIDVLKARIDMKTRRSEENRKRIQMQRNIKIQQQRERTAQVVKRRKQQLAEKMSGNRSNSSSRTYVRKKPKFRRHSTAPCLRTVRRAWTPVKRPPVVTKKNVHNKENHYDAIFSPRRKLDK